MSELIIAVAVGPSSMELPRLALAPPRRAPAYKPVTLVKE